jgi:phosphoenolpyruvate carboxylase
MRLAAPGAGALLTIAVSDVHRDELAEDVNLLSSILGDTIKEHAGAEGLALIEDVRRSAVALRGGELAGGRNAFAARFAALDLEGLNSVARWFTLLSHLINSAEEQHRVRVLRRRDRPDAPVEGSIAAAISEAARAGVHPDEVRRLLDRLFVMPVLTAHPTEARRRTVLEHLTDVSVALDTLDDGRRGARERDLTFDGLRETISSLAFTEEARPSRPTPLDEVRAGLHTFETTLFDATTGIYRELEDALAAGYPNESFTVGPFLRWGTWIGGDRDGNPNVTADITRIALEHQRSFALRRYQRDVVNLGRALSVSARRLSDAQVPAALDELNRSLGEDRARLPEIAARAGRSAAREPWREKLSYMQARLEATRSRSDAGYPSAEHYQADLELLERSFAAGGLPRLALGRLRDARRRAQVFGFHLATLDIRQHSAFHEAAVAELLAQGGVSDYKLKSEAERTRLLAELLDRADVGTLRDRRNLSPQTRELITTLEVVGRARRDSGAAACERYVVSFTSTPSDILEVLLLARAASLAPDEIRPVPLLEQLEDLERAESTARRLLELRPVRVALRGELEVMIGYSDSGKQAGYVASQVALGRAQEALARVADDENVMLTVFHGRGGTIGRGGGPANRAIRAQPRAALRGRLRVTEQGETIAARYGRPEIASRDLEQMVSAVILGSVAAEPPTKPETRQARQATLAYAARAARETYNKLLADPDRLARYALSATPIQEVAELPIASRPSSRRAGLSFEDLRAIPWVFSWNQSRHGLPGWFGLGAALDAIAAEEGIARARELYATWPFFRALVDNAQLSLTRADIDVAAQYAQLADVDARALFDVIREEHTRTVARVLEVTQAPRLLAAWPTVAETVERRNPFVDALSHTQIELLRRLREAPPEQQARIREVLFTTVGGIAAGLQTAG